jgi:hypothetical protein
VHIVADLLPQDKRETWNSLCRDSLSWLFVSGAQRAADASEARTSNDASEAHTTNDASEVCRVTDTAETHGANDTSNIHGVNDASKAHGSIASSTSTWPPVAGNTDAASVHQSCDSFSPFSESFRYHASNGMAEAEALQIRFFPSPLGKGKLHPWNLYNAIAFLTAQMKECAPSWEDASYTYYDILRGEAKFFDQLAFQLPSTET